MRLAFFLFLLINLAFHVWSAGYLGTSNEGRETERLNQQIFPEKLRIVANSQQVAPKEPKPATTGCRAVGGLSLAEATAVEKALQASTGVAVSLRASVETSYWVLISGLANRPAADKKVGELRQRDVVDIKVVNDETHGPFVVSLGLYSSDEAAQEHLLALNKKGVRSARVEKHEKPGATASLEIRADTDWLLRLPDALAAYPAVTLGECQTEAKLP